MPVAPANPAHESCFFPADSAAPGLRQVGATAGASRLAEDVVGTVHKDGVVEGVVARLAGAAHGAAAGEGQAEGELALPGPGDRRLTEQVLRRRGWVNCAGEGPRRVSEPVRGEAAAEVVMSGSGDG